MAVVLGGMGGQGGVGLLGELLTCNGRRRRHKVGLGLSVIVLR